MNGNLRQLIIGTFDGRIRARAHGLRHILLRTVLAVMAGPLNSVAIHAADQPALQPQPTAAVLGAKEPVEQPKVTDAPKATDEPAASFRAAVHALVAQEARKTGLPADIADAVVYIESNYDPAAIGSVGEIGLMQIRPGTAAMLGFKGSAEELAKPETNIHYGVTYLSKAWRLADGDLCRTLMKYRAGHGEQVMTQRSLNYCNRARNHLAALGAALASTAPPPAIIPPSVIAKATPELGLPSPMDVYLHYRQGTPAASRAFWVAHEARIRAITAKIEARWHRVASR